MPDCHDPRGDQPTIVRQDHRRQAVAEGLADIAAGRFVTGSDIEAWLDRLWLEPNLPAPQSAHAGSR